jgi:pyrroloquinoline quinone (PQQ) biosynthesis protein C
MSASSLIAALRHELAPISENIRNHPYIGALERGEVPRDKLSIVAGEQYFTIKNDLRSFSVLLARQQDTRLMRFVTGSVNYEAAALAALFDFAAALGLGEDDLRWYQPLAGAQAYTSFLGLTAFYGSVAEMAAAYVVDLEGWGGNCGAMSRILKERYGFDESKVRFFDHFAAEDPEFEPRSFEVIDIGLEQGVDSRDIARTARLMLEYELMYWDALHAASVG